MVRTLWSGISRGTERLVYTGQVPEGEYARMRAPLQEGEFPFPVKYGYAAVGLVEASQGESAKDLVGKRVFALHPHQDRFWLPVASVVPVPADTPAQRAILAANMETALNGIWDAAASPGDRIVIVGGGVLGGLLAGLCGAMPGAEVLLVDIAPQRETLAADMNVMFARASETPDARGAGADIVFHTSATEAGLRTALSYCGTEARLVELSWYGAAAPSVPLGAEFHSQRLQIVSSQVGQVAAARRVRWSHRRRLSKALDLLANPQYDRIVTDEVAFEVLPDALPRILGPGADGLATAVRYGAERVSSEEES